MSIRVAINHQMHYAYDKYINVGPQVIRLKPAVHSRTPIHSYSLKISPENHFINWQQDPFGNFLARVVFPEKVNKMEIDVEVIADLKVVNPFDFFVDEYAEKYPFQYDKQLQKELAPYLVIDEEGELLKDFLEKEVPKDEEMQIVDFLVAINQALYKKINYTIRLEPGIQSCEETLSKALGSCRDSAWVLVQVFRHLGLAARFASGYLVQLTADEKSLDGPSGPEEDFTDLHAWAEVFIPGAGWIGLDVTSGLFAGEGHIPLSCTPDPTSAAPLTGATDPVEATFNYKNEVIRIHEEPRVTKPYSEEQWQNILEVGKKVDTDLKAMDVRLTMGGEPTFVSIDDMESAEWNTTADGPHKRKLAQELTARLRDSFCPTGMLHFGQGKLYPGEVLPRWQYGIFWRKDGKPIWRNNELLASPAKKGRHTNEDAKAFLEKFTDYLKLPNEAIIPAYEDAFYFAWEENKLPTDVDPLKKNLKDSIERRTLTDVLTKGMKEPTGFVLPLRHKRTEESWETCKWPFRRNHLFLIPGNSTIGYRLPLNSLPKDIMDESAFPRDPFDENPDLVDFEKKIQDDKRKTTKIREDVCFKTAICTHIVEGRIHIFLPPQDLLEHYLEIIAAIHLTATELNTQVILEGYEPPSEGQLNKLFVTPDPGVIEVNVHPSLSWEELCKTTLTLYEEAKHSRLGTEKFMVDGRHTGTGGGNHITIGGTKPSDSPLLRKPKLLQSIITYWQHHPSLSYLFSGPFIGPTSQAPRVDEGRDDVLYELEIAFSQVPDDEDPPFWLADRLFRNLLIDVTGNTHRAELCIDKLYSPYGSAGRQGILEFRGFDMPPHAQMSLAQNLLIRALIARFWKKPYEKRLVHWGTELHDRFMLEHYVRHDMNEIISELQEAGYAFERSWFDAFIEFRFPVLGKAQFNDITLELRWAIEPWNVLGEEITSQGTARYVDSSVERVQVKVNGWVSERYILACNQTRIPLRSTGIKGQYVAGVRYKAWAPPSALHPTIGVDTPLVFDIIDTWNDKSIGGFTYHVAHPGGRSYDDIPVNSNAAESRRHTRFFSEGHTQGNVKTVQEYTAVGRFFEEKRDTRKIDVPIEEQSIEFPNTLDLRKKRS